MATHQVAIATEPRLKPVQALNRLADLTTGFCAAQAFRAAWKFGLFEEMSERAATAEELAGRVNIHPVGCRRLLMALAKLGLVVRDGDLYHNSELGQYCSSQSAVNLGALPASLDPFYHMFEYLPDALREYSPRWQQALGTSQEEAFGALYEDPVRLGRFAELMNAFSIVQGQLIAENFDFAPYHCLMDVAGGLGGQAVQIGPETYSPVRRHHRSGSGVRHGQKVHRDQRTRRSVYRDSGRSFSGTLSARCRCDPSRPRLARLE